MSSSFFSPVSPQKSSERVSSWPSFMRGRKLAQTLHEFWLTHFLSVREGTREELSHHEGIYNMHYFLACRTNVMSTLRLLKRVFCYTKLF